jgi:uncharacterized protein with beta-barrel porin domain
LPRKPALSERKKSAREAVLSIVSRHLRGTQAHTAAAVELSQPVVGDTLAGEKPAHIESLLLMADVSPADAAIALDIVDDLRDLLRDRIRSARDSVSSHVTHRQSGEAPTQQGLTRTALRRQ